MKGFVEKKEDKQGHDSECSVTKRVARSARDLIDDITFSIFGFFLVLYLCLVLAICKLLGVNIEEDFYD